MVQFSHKDKIKEIEIDSMIRYIIDSIDLSQIIKEAEVKKYTVKLVCGDYDREKNGFIWYDKSACYLNYFYKISLARTNQFIKANQHKIIKISVSSKDIHYPVCRNTIILLPYEIDLSIIKKLKIGLVR